MKAGFAKEIITPDSPMPMAGFDRRHGVSDGVLDELYVSALALEPDDGEPFLICSFDLLGTDSDLCCGIRDAVSSELGVSGRRVWVCATHTHSGPSGIFSNRGNYCAGYVARLCARSAAAARRALSCSSDVSVRTAEAYVPDVASLRDRARAESQYRMPLLLVRFDSPGRRILLCRLACHPTVLDERNLFYSADLPGAVGRAMPAGTDCIFLNGACADLSTRYTRSRSSPEEMNRLGKLVAGYIEGAGAGASAGFGRAILSSTLQMSAPRSGGLPESMRLEMREAIIEKERACRDDAARRELESKLAVLERPPAKPEPGNTAEISAVDFGPFILLGLPFEVASRDGEAIEAELSPYAGKPVFTACYTGGYAGYLPSGKPLSACSSYQDVASRYDPLLRERLICCARTCIDSLQ